MHNKQENKEFLLEEQDEKYHGKTAWMIIWFRQWNTSNWLMSSFLSTIILSEIYAVVLSVSPNFILSFWLYLGIHSLILSSFLTVICLIAAGLLCGALTYSAHLTYNAMKIYEINYQPLIDVWSSNTKIYGAILEQLLDDDHFYKMTQVLKDFAPAEPLQKFLRNEENIESVKKILVLLKQIWTADSLDSSFKTLAISLLSEYVQEKNAKERINHIWQLWELLKVHDTLNVDTMLYVIKNSSIIAPYFQQLQLFINHPEVIQMVVEKPELLPYLNAVNTTFKNDAPEFRAENIRSLYQSFQSAAPLTQKSICIISPHPTVTIHSEITQLLKSLHDKDTHTFICIWDKLVHHKNLDWAEKLVLKLNHEKYQVMIQDPLKILRILSIFGNLSVKKDPEIQAFKQRLAFLSQEESYEKIIEILFLLDSIDFFHIGFIERLLLKSDLSACELLLKVYIQHVFDKSESPEKLASNMEKLLLHNNLLNHQLNILADNQMTSEENISLIIKNYLYPELIHVQENHHHLSKKFNPFKKIQKLLNMTPPTKDPHHVIINVSSTPLSPVLIEESENYSSLTMIDEARKTHQHWSKTKNIGLFSMIANQAKSKSQEDHTILSNPTK